MRPVATGNPTDMDRQTKGILLIAAVVIISYIGWFFVGCAMDDTCQIVLCGRHICGIAKTTDSKPRTDLWLHTRR
jgi:hypothetical protein